MNEFFNDLSWPTLTLLFAAVLLALIGAARLCYRMNPDHAQAPLLDIWISLFTWVPWAIGILHAGWMGLLASLVAQLMVLHIFCLSDRFLRGGKSPAIISTLEKMVGVGRNQMGLYTTLPALPLFLQVRLGQCVLYPILRGAVKFPKYQHRDWISVSRQKFEGLAGYDLLFCLYCDWAAGVYSLGAEMLRNVESFWCPIRFHHEKKCENCRMDFPDLGGWVKPEGNMAEVSLELKTRYAGRPTNSWWGHSDRKSPS